MRIYKGGIRQLTKNFNEKEIYSKSSDAPDSHYFSDDTLNGAQIIRDHVGVAVHVNSTYRTQKDNDRVKGGSKSQHLKGNAIDLDMDQKKLDEVKKDFRRRGPLFKKLRAAGINGFGLYSGFIHVDSRPEGGLQSDEFGTYAYWDKESSSEDQKKKQ